MTRADLSRIATLRSMTHLGVESTEGLERPGGEPTTPPEEFDGRNGYEPAFLDGWPIPMPAPIGPAADDVRALRRGGNGHELKYRNFSVIMSASRRLPMVTAANIDGADARRVPRISTWSFDGRLDKEDQWGDELYFNNPLDRGHMVRREDPIWGSIELAHQANVDSFHFTNSCPQIAGVNQRTWLGLEDYILQHARVDGMRVNVFTGPFLTETDLEHSSGARIPGAFWKVVAIVTEDGRPSATAYEVSQARELADLEFVFAGYKTYQVSLQSISDRARIDFSALVEYDGFSEHEHTTGQRLVEVLDSLESIRI